MDFYEKLTNCGIEAGMEVQFSKKIKITNQIALALSIIGMCYVVIFSCIGYFIAAAFLALPIIALWAVVYLNKIKWYNIARVWTFVVVVGVVYLYAIVFGRDTGFQLVFFPCVCLPWVCFDIKDWKYILLLTVLSIFSYLSYYFLSLPALLPLSAGNAEFINITISVTVFAYITLCLRFLTIQNQKAENILISTYQHFFEDIPSPMYIFDTSTLRFLAINQNAIDSYGYTKGEILKMVVTDLHPPGNKEEHDKLIYNKILNEHAYDGGYLLHRKKSGEVFYVHILSNRTVYKGKEARVVQAINVNDKILSLAQIEELKATQEELKAQKEELGQINLELAEKSAVLEHARNSLAIKATELETANKYKSEFLANMSHELRTPLNSILILARLLSENKNNNLNPKQLEYAEIIRKSGTDLLELINDVLDISKIESGNVIISLSHVSVAEIIHDLEQLFTVVANKKNIEFKIELALDTPPVIRTDKLRLEQILKNLLSNAFKFTHEGGWVKLSFYMHSPFLLAVAVADNGIGIPANKQEVIFEAFRQVDGSTSRKYEGTGLGLSISRELVKKLEGTLTVSSAPDLGSVFTVCLPVNNNDTTHAIQADGAMTSFNGLKLEDIKEQTILDDDRLQLLPGEASTLIIERDPFFAAYLSDAANKNGMKKIIALSAEEGLLCALKFKPAIIVLDPLICVADGRKVLNLLRSHTELKDIPVQLITDKVLAGKTALIVDDDVRNVFALRALLEEQGMEVVTAEHGKDALKRLSDIKGIDIVLMDIMMPEMDGYETIARIRAMQQFETLPVIALTARAMPGDHEKCIAVGASDYIAKPVDAARLFALLRNWL